MKPLIILARITFIGLLWSIFFIEGIRVIMLSNWRFDIFRISHWEYAWNLWLSGWVIDNPKEWAFILIILSSIPLLLAGWAALSLIKWENIILKLLELPTQIYKNLFYKPVKIIATNNGRRVPKKKSYKEIRPRRVASPIEERSAFSPSPLKVSNNIPMVKTSANKMVNTTPTTSSNNNFDHSLFQFDNNEDDFEFDFDAFDKDDNDKATPAPTSTPPAQKKNNKPLSKKNATKTSNQFSNTNSNKTDNPKAPKPIGNSSLEVIRQKGYDVLSGLTIKNTLIDFIAVSSKQICLCMLDKEPGDWLADEERFNDEEPLWFSESSHRISPIRKLDLARQILQEKLEEQDLHFEIIPYIIEQIGNIINAEDMFEIWKDMGINVTRIDRGTPKELKLFAKELPDVDDKIEKDKLDQLKKIIKTIA